MNRPGNIQSHMMPRALRGFGISDQAAGGILSSYLRVGREAKNTSKRFGATEQISLNFQKFTAKMPSNYLKRTAFGDSIFLKKTARGH